MKIMEFAKYKYLDAKYAFTLRKQGIKLFKEYGMTLYAGRQGGGKTMSMVKQANDWREEYEGLFIASNFGYEFEDFSLKGFKDILKVVEMAKERQAIGVLVLWDEIQNDIDSFSKTPIEILRFITQQRKQGVKILATSQVFTRVSKAIREQTYEVVECSTFLGRWTFNRCYDADVYELYFDNPEKRKDRLVTKNKVNFIQTDYLRGCYDSYMVIQTLNERVKQEDKKQVIAIGVEN